MDLFPEYHPLESQPLMQDPLFCCSKMRAYQNATEWWVSIQDLFLVLENTSAKSAIEKFSQQVNGRKQPVNREWIGSSWIQITKPELLMIPISQLEESCHKILKKSRKTKIHKQSLFKKLGLDISLDSISAPIESSILDGLSQACPFPLEFQYYIGRYRLDAFIPRLRVAIQIDENDHRGYSQNEEKEMNSCLRDNNIVCLRFAANRNDPNIQSLQMQLIAKVWELSLAPDFQVFRNKMRLT